MLNRRRSSKKRKRKRRRRRHSYRNRSDQFRSKKSVCQELCDLAEWRWPPTFLISSFIVSNFVPLVCPIPIFSLSLYILRRRRPAALFLSSYLSVSTYFFPSIYMYFVLLIYLSLSTSFC